MDERPVELETVTIRRGAAPVLLGCGLLALAAAFALGAVAPLLLAADGQPLQAAVLLLMAVAAATTTLADGPARAARGFVGWALGCLGARRCLTVVERGGRRALRLEVRSDARRFTLHEVPLEAVLGASPTTLQGGQSALHVECVEGALFEPCPADDATALAATVTRWLDAARASGSHTGPRCAICHARADGELLATCPTCATRFHAACEVELGGGCPTLGCARTATPEPSSREADRLEVALPSLALGPRVLAAVWVALAAVAATLVTRGLRAPAASDELVQGVALGSITLLPLGIGLAFDRTRVVEELLSALLGAGRRTLSLDRTTSPPLLTIGWRLGPLRLTLDRVALDATVTLDVAPLTEGWRVLLAGPRRVRLADGLGLASARRIAGFLRLAPSSSTTVAKGRDEKARASER